MSRQNNRRHNRYSRRRSLWAHSKPFRQLSYGAMCVGLVFLLGAWSDAKQHATGSSTHQTHQGNSTTSPTPPTAPPTSPPIPTQPVVQLQTAQPVQNGLDHFPLANKTLGHNVNPNNVLPVMGFDAYYMNADKPNVLIAKEHVQQVAINYSYDEFHRIPSEKFLAYWVGKLRVPQDGVYEISGNLSWSSARVLINKHIIVDDTNSFSEKTVYLTKGEYTVEVEYRNNWHTTNFQSSIKPYATTIPSDNLRQTLDSLNLPNNTVVYAASAYESQNRDNRILVKTPTHDTRPYILLLYSYESVNWEVVGNHPPTLIVHSSKDNVRASIFSKTLFSDYAIAYDAFSAKRSCHCLANGHFHCDDSGNDAHQVAQDVQSRFGYPLVGFSGEYAAGTLVLPSVTITPNLLNQLGQNKQKQAAEEQACKASATRGFEDMVK